MEDTLSVDSSEEAEWVGSVRAALDSANIPTLLLVLRHLTGDSKWTSDPFSPKRGKPLDDNDSAGLSEDLQDEVRAAALVAASQYRSGLLQPTTPTPDDVAEMLGTALVEEVPASYGELLSEEMGFLSREVPIDPATIPTGFRVVVIGSGLSGLCMAIKLEAAGIDYVVLEKNQNLGGTWLENVYPGCGVDTPGHLYSFSFAPNPDISRYFAGRDEVFSYLERLAVTSGVLPKIEFGTEVERVEFGREDNRWRLQVRRGPVPEEIVADVVISAVGMVNRPAIPAIPGLDGFAGPVLHTAAWDPEVDLRDKRVAVIGTGASAMQLVPAIADTAAHVTVFQRSKQWAVPHPNYHREIAPEVSLLMHEFPFYLQWYRLRSFWNFSDRLHSSLQIDPQWPHPERSVNQANDRHRVFLTNYIREQLGDRTDLIEASLPDYPPYGKRPLIDNRWYKTLLRDDVSLVTEAVDRVSDDEVVGASGTVVEADVIVLATGFKVLQFLWPMEILGRSGMSMREKWGEQDARAYLGVTVPDFPNFFILNGPNTNAGHGGSTIHSTEFQVRYVMQGIAALLGGDSATLDVDEGVFVEYNRELDEALARTVWSHRGMSTYYRNEFGRVVVSSPWKYVDYWSRIHDFDPAQYHGDGRRQAAG